MTAEIIVEFPSPLTEKEQRMIYGYKGELIRCKDCKHRDWDVVDIPYGLTKHIEWCSIRFNAEGENIEVSPNDFCSKAESKVSSSFE